MRLRAGVAASRGAQARRAARPRRQGRRLRAARCRRAPPIRVYTPHGGSLHYGRHTLRGMVYGAIERLLSRRTELFLFESAFARNAYEAMVGAPRGVVRVVPNGISAAEMAPVAPDPDAADHRQRRRIPPHQGHRRADRRRGRAAPIGPARERSPSPATARKARRSATRWPGSALTDSVRFLGHTPARQAFAHGRLLVVPSRADSLPYVVIEAGGAGIPIIASGVGGIPEILGPDGDHGAAGAIPARLATGDRRRARRSGRRRGRRRRACASASASCSRRTPWSRACWPVTQRSAQLRPSLPQSH